MFSVMYWEEVHAMYFYAMSMAFSDSWNMKYRDFTGIFLGWFEVFFGKH